MGLLSWLSGDKTRGERPQARPTADATTRPSSAATKTKSPSKGAGTSKAANGVDKSQNQSSRQKSGSKTATDGKKQTASQKATASTRDEAGLSNSRPTRGQQENGHATRASDRSATVTKPKKTVTVVSPQKQQPSRPQRTSRTEQTTADRRQQSNGGAASGSTHQQKQQQQRQQPFSGQKRNRNATTSTATTSTTSTSSLSGGSDDNRAPGPSQATGGGAAAAAAPNLAAGLKRSRSTYRMRPLIVDEKLRVFVEGRDEELLNYDGGDFYLWLKDCEAGRADPADGFSYPLIVQDNEFRELLHIKGPTEISQPVPPPPAKRPKKKAGGSGGASTSAAAGGNAADIRVPTCRVLPENQIPDVILQEREQELLVIQRLDGAHAHIHGLSPAAQQAATAAYNSAQEALARDPPYVRFVEPTPDELDLSIEYDLDEEDEEWREEYNKKVNTKSKARAARQPLAEEWMEHLMDRMEKEYTAELQRRPETWVIHHPPMNGGDGSGGLLTADDASLPSITFPPISEIFPLSKCLALPGINHYESVIKAVYEYWKEKHERAGRPLIQRLWYEPPWHRKKAAGLSAGGEDGEGRGGPFAGHDSPVLQGIRRRKMDPIEVRERFEGIRRDLEAVRTLTDQIRRREKLKRRETQLLKEEWAARMQDIADGQRVMLTKGQLRNRPAKPYVLQRLGGGGGGHGSSLLYDPLAYGGSGVGGADGFTFGVVAGEVIPAPSMPGDRAARLAARRDARDRGVGFGGGGFPSMMLGGGASGSGIVRQQQQVQRPARPPPRDRSAGFTAATAVGGGGGTKKGITGTTKATGGSGSSAIKCHWCGVHTSSMLSCTVCPKSFCSKCWQQRPGHGVASWNRALKDYSYECTYCQGKEEDDEDDDDLDNELDIDEDASNNTYTGTDRQTFHSLEDIDEEDAVVGYQQHGRPRRGRQQQQQQQSRGGGGSSRGHVGNTSTAAAGLATVGVVGGKLLPPQPRTASGRFASFSPGGTRRSQQQQQQASQSKDSSSSESDSDSDTSSSSSSSSDDSSSDEEEEEDNAINAKETVVNVETTTTTTRQLPQRKRTAPHAHSDAEEGVVEEDDDSALQHVAAVAGKKGGAKENRPPQKPGASKRARVVSPAPAPPPPPRSNKKQKLQQPQQQQQQQVQKKKPVASPNNDKVSKELAALLGQTIPASQRRSGSGAATGSGSGKTVNAKNTSTAGVNKKSGGGNNKKEKKRTSGPSKADLEIVLQEPVTSPSRKLRGRG